MVGPRIALLVIVQALMCEGAGERDYTSLAVLVSIFGVEIFTIVIFIVLLAVLCVCVKNVSHVPKKKNVDLQSRVEHNMGANEEVVYEEVIPQPIPLTTVQNEAYATTTMVPTEQNEAYATTTRTQGTELIPHEYEYL